MKLILNIQYCLLHILFSKILIHLIYLNTFRYSFIIIYIYIYLFLITDIYF
jgi:hypothetical protein